MATTLSTVQRQNVGSLSRIIATFSDIDDDGTWSSGIPNPIGYWLNPTDDPTQTKEGIDVTLTTAATGVFTFHCGENTRTGVLYVEGYF